MNDTNVRTNTNSTNDTNKMSKRVVVLSSGTAAVQSGGITEISYAGNTDPSINGVPTTYADATAIERDFGFTPKITLREGMRMFAEGYEGYYG